MQFQVPQFIETEDKIVGPLTLKQFVYVAIAAGVSFLLFFIVATWLWFVLTVFLATIAFSLAFIKINGQPMVRVMFSAAKFFWQPQTFVWQPEAQRRAAVGATTPTKPGGFSLQSIVAGMALRNTWQKVQTGTVRKPGEVSPNQIGEKIKERYQIFEKITGERQAARRVDYR